MTYSIKSLNGIPDFGLKSMSKAMIDTIVLTIPRSKFLMLDLTSRGVSAWDLQARTRVYDKLVRNPSSRDIETGLYFPRLTGYRRKGDNLQWDSTVRIEFSAPKLIYQNNIDELTDAEFEAVVEALCDRLKRMGVVITKRELIQAPVASLHYSRNVELRNGYTAQYVIRELGKMNLNKCFDLTRARYMNDGQSLYAYTTAHSFVVYDKIADLIRGKKRSIDRDQPVKQLTLFERLNKKREILRFEVRLSQKQKMNALFRELGLSENPTFKDVFSSEKSKAVLMHYWNKMIEPNSLLLFAHSPSQKDLLNQILRARARTKGKAAVYLTGLVSLARDGAGLRELRSILTKRNSDRSWYTMKRDLEGITADLSKLCLRDWYDQVKSAIMTPEPFHI